MLGVSVTIPKITSLPKIPTSPPFSRFLLAFPFKKKKTLKGKTSVSFVDTKVTAGRTYYYKVVAYRKVSGKKIYGKESAKAHMKK